VAYTILRQNYKLILNTVISVLLLFNIFFFNTLVVKAVDGDDDFELPLDAKAAILIDANSGEILYEKNKDEERAPASTIKIVTALLTLENLDLNTVVTTDRDTVLSIPSGATAIYLQEGEKMKASDLLKATIIKSANDSAAVLAKEIAGSKEDFATMMNDRVAQLGLTNTHFTNSNGLDENENYTSAYDLAMIMRECIKNEEFMELIQLTDYTLPATNKHNEQYIFSGDNLIIEQSKYYYEYAVGGKTGYTGDAGFTMVSLAEKDGMKLIAVTLGNSSKVDRYTDAKTLYDYGFNNFILKSFPRSDFQNKTYEFTKADISFELNEDISMLVPIAKKDSVFSYKYEVLNENDPDNITALINLYLDNEFVRPIFLTKIVDNYSLTDFKMPFNPLQNIFTIISIVIFIFLLIIFCLRFFHYNLKMLK